MSTLILIAQARPDNCNTRIPIYTKGGTSGLLGRSNHLNLSRHIFIVFLPSRRQFYGMKTAVTLDPTNRIVLTKAIRQAAGIPEGATLSLSAAPGVILLSPEPKRAKIVKKGKIKVLYGNPPTAPVQDDVNESRR
jgi:hypothetical protein